MDAKQAIESTMDSGFTVLHKYVGDLDDADLMERPGPGCNHLAWQLGHLIASEPFLVDLVCPGQGAKLPAGFAEAHAKDKCDVDDPAQFLTRDEYLKLYDQVRAATKKALADLPAERLDDPAPERFRSVFPTVGSVLLLVGNHPLMHAGQFVPVRRRKGKPVVI
ncbi:MAG: DinB family protein [Planctomycetaceae bacterium]|nr:DinB family protein [Planctomycetaceae bacterium]